MQVSRESALLTALCAADTVLTLWLIATERGTEANPILRFYLAGGGVLCFAAAKILLSLGPVFVLEQLRTHRPQFVRLLLRASIALYLLTYVLGVWRVNT